MPFNRVQPIRRGVRALSIWGIDCNCCIVAGTDCSLRMLWAVVLLAHLTTVTGAAERTFGRVLHGEELQDYKKELVRGLPKQIRTSVMNELHILPCEQIKKVYAVCCKGECNTDAVAFLVTQYKKFTQGDIGTFATHLRDYIASYFNENLGSVPVESGRLEWQDAEDILGGLGQWYKRAEYQTEDDETLRKALTDASFGPPRAELQRHIAGPVQSLPDGVRMNMLSVLGVLPYRDVRMLHNVVCKENGECDVDAAAFTVQEYRRFAPVGISDDKVKFSVATFAQDLKRCILSHLDKVNGLHLDHDCFAHLDGTSFLKSLGQWYRGAGYKIESNEAFQNAFADIIFPIDDPYAKRLRVALLFHLAGQPVSKTLFDYWMKQPDEVVAKVHRCLPDGGKYRDLLILQPLVFDIEFIRKGDFTEEGYGTKFENYFRSTTSSSDLQFFCCYFARLDFSDVAEAFRGMEEKTKAEGLGTLEKERLEIFTERRLPAELGFKVATCLLDAPLSLAHDVILDANDEGSLRALDRQLWALQSSKCIESMTYYERFFPLTRITNYLGERSLPPPRSMVEYRAVVDKILWGLVLDELRWHCIESELRDHLKVGTFWKLLSFLEEYPQYGGLFGAVFHWSADSQRASIDELVLRKLEIWIRKIIGLDEEKRREELNSIVEKMITVELEGQGHPWTEDRYAQLREQFHGNLFTIFKTSVYVSPSLDRYILSTPAGIGELDGLHDLQVAVVVNFARCISQVFTSDLDLKMYEDMMKGYSTEQLANIYNSDFKAPLFLMYHQLREFDPDLFEFAHPVGRAGLYALLSRVCRQANSDRESFFGSVLDRLGQALAFSIPLLMIHNAIADVLKELPYDQDFLGNSGAGWLKLAQSVYAKCSDGTRRRLMGELNPKLTALISAAGNAIDTRRYTTFDELFEAAMELGRTILPG